MSSPAPLTIVTGASSNHFHCLRNLLSSISVHEPQARVLVYDLGLSHAEHEQLTTAGVECRVFPFAAYPPHVDLRIDCGVYAWKPIIVAEVLDAEGSLVLWLDAGNLVHAPLLRVRDVLASVGLYTPASAGVVRQWTHVTTLMKLRAAPPLFDRPNRTGGIVGLSAASSAARELAARWKACALDRQCIAPPGSHRGNHRHDQSLLTILAYQLQAKYGFPLEDQRFDITTHNDRLTAQEACALLKTGSEDLSRF